MTVARGESSPERLGGALRRLHYKATRRAHSAAARHHNSSNPPKVVVMGSSTTSDKTINTSTDSAATALTSITGTDDSMDAEPEPPEPPPQPPSLIDAEPAPTNPNPPSTAPPHYHRAQNSCEIDSPKYTKPQSATETLDSPRPGPARFIFDVPLPDPRKAEKPRNKTQVLNSAPSTSIQIPYDPKTETPKSPKAIQAKYETHFKFEPEPVKRRGSEPRMKNKQKMDKQEYYKDEVAKLRRQLEGTEVFTTTRRRSSAHQHSVPPPSSRRQSTAAQVHVTANPLDSAATTIPAGRTTIVVQQPSLSLDYGGCSTILVRDEDGRRKSRVCSDHIQQLLDVTSQFTSEDLHDFDKSAQSLLFD
ncbi:probable serine/threonine-protein kinase samkC [Ostrinia furnacalis]|uniref:probable serine/threonine-protein kinase samkC n=1 Tax=Ostrinia furnacalis TaxID=93504 RepID=UPI00103E13E9|nr:probable serine/threonine-protein kinase samkC [Ostrinia furnacalis]